MRATLDPTKLAAIEQVLDSTFSHSAQNKALYYHVEGKVRQVAVATSSPDGTITVQGSVQCTEPQPYQVEARISIGSGAPVFEGKCSCPAGRNCKHLAAVLLHASDQDDEASDNSEKNGLDAASTAREPTQPRPPVATLPTGLQVWLRKLEDAAQPGALTVEDNTYPPGVIERLVYLLKPQNGSLTVELQLVQMHPRGGYQSGRKLAVEWIVAQEGFSEWIRPIDRLLAARLQASWGSRAFLPTHLTGRGAVDMLKSLLGTGRCHFRSSTKAHPALHLGEARPAKPIWVMDRHGNQRPGFEITPAAAHVLPLTPPWYVDERAAVCGPLETGMADEVGAAWLEAPVVDPATASKLAGQLTRRAPGLGVVAPQPIELVEINDIEPVPCLRLFSAQGRSYYAPYYSRRDRDSGLTTVSLAELTFDYQGWTVRPDRSQHTQEFRDGAVRRLHRRIPAERHAEGILYEEGLTPAMNQLYQLPANSRHALTLPDADAWFDFVHRRLVQLRAEGWRIEIDPTFQFRIAEPESWYADADELGGDNDWFGVELGVVLEGEKLNLLPILIQHFQSNPKALSTEALAALGENGVLPVVLPDGRALGFPAKRLRGMLGVLLDLLDAEALTKRGKLKLRKLRAVELSGLAADADWRWLGGAELQAINQRLRKFEGIKPVTPSPNLQTTLRPYQQEGLNWLQFLREYDLGGVLADDMGLGKTVQALAHLLAEKESGRADRPSLVIAPTSLMTNWRQETERFAPSLRVLVLHGLERKQNFDRVTEHDLIITSYPLLPRDQNFLLEQRFHCVILDEAQYIKNPKTIYAQVACQLQARHHLCLTGTPMENHLGELWSLFNFLLPGFLGHETRFNAVFRRPIEKSKCEDRRKLLARRVGPFLLRRRKEEVVKELPPKTEIVQNVELNGGQRDLYESIRLAMHQRVKEEVDKKGLNRAHIIILDALLKLRQVCCDPRLVSLPSARQVKESAKLELLMDLLPGMVEEGRRILLFSQFTSMLALIEQALDERRLPYVLLTGDTRDRATPIQKFQNRQVPLFLISLKAGGTGLNLTAADTVIHYDPWWNPAVENQATDRAHRIGQDKPVFVYKLMTVGTVEEKIGALQARKRELVEGLLNEERRANLQLSADDLDVLFAPLG